MIVKEESNSKMVSLTDLERKFTYRSRSWLRSILKREENKLSEIEREKLVQNIGGSKGKLYNLNWAENVFHQEDIDSSSTLARIFRSSDFEGVLHVNSKGKSETSVAGLLESRKEANSAYEKLLSALINESDELLIRVISGQDLFNDYRPTANMLRERGCVNNKTTKVLFLYPFGDPADIRIKAEEEKSVNHPTFILDAFRTLSFIAGRRSWHIEPKWVNILHHTFMVWGNQYAIVEPYDFGKPGTNLSGCIGRKAPLLVVKGGSPYHQTLKHGFEYIYGENLNEKTYSKTGIKTYTLEEVSKTFKEKKGLSIHI